MGYSSLAAAAACAGLASGHTISYSSRPTARRTSCRTASGRRVTTARPTGQPKATDAVLDVMAGSAVTAVWRHTLDSSAEDVMDSSYLGSTLAYLKKVEDATSDLGVGDGR
ncbi:hypothetical protein DL765_004387 [Monosporascus sp. GIB2]|nr:hypothetical protein DL765_004387 [Monosporascus sp. GIB2]